MTINNIVTNTAGTFQQSDILDPKAWQKQNIEAPNDGFITQNTGINHKLNGSGGGVLNLEDHFFAHETIDIDTGSGDNQVTFNGQVYSPLDINTGSGKDHVVFKQSGCPGPHNAIIEADETGITVNGPGKSDCVNFTKDGTASINGQTMVEGKLYELADGGTAELKNGELTVTNGAGGTIKQSTNNNDNGPFIDVSVIDSQKDDGKRYLWYQPPKMNTNTDLGSGDDQIEISASGSHTVDMGTGDDIAYVGRVDNKERNHTDTTINGGDGNDKVTLVGSRSDYAVSREDGYNVYTDQDGNRTEVADDVEDVRFLMDDIGSHEYPGNIVWDEDPGDRVSWG